MKNASPSKQEQPFRPGEEEQIHQASIRRLMRKRRSTERVQCPQCRHHFRKPPEDHQPVPQSPFFRTLSSWTSPHNSRRSTIMELLIRHLSTPPRLRGAKPDLPTTIIGSLEAGYTDRFFTALRRWPEVLLEPEVWFLTIGLWYKQKIAYTPEGQQARKYLKAIGSALADPRGRPEIPKDQRIQRKQQSTRESKRRHDAKVKEAVAQLEKKVLAERANGRPATALTRALASSQTTMKVAARKVQEKLDKGRL